MPPSREPGFHEPGFRFLTTTIGNISHSAHLVELIARALMLGRWRVSIPVEERLPSAALEGLFPWLENISKEIDQGVSTSALGTRFEAQLRGEVLIELGIASSAFATEVWGKHQLPKENAA